MSICQNNHLHETPRTWFKAEQRHVLYYICLPLFTRRARFEFIVWHLLSKCVQCSSKGNSTLWKTRRRWYHATIGNAHFAALASKNWFAFLFSSSSSSLSLEFTELLDLRLSRTRFPDQSHQRLLETLARRKPHRSQIIRYQNRNSFGLPTLWRTVLSSQPSLSFRHSVG